MEDLVPFLFFIVIIVVNALKFFIEKGGKAKKSPNQSEKAPPRRATFLDSFFGNLAQQMAPKPTKLAEWPEGRERPDYIHEMETFEEDDGFKEEVVTEPLVFSGLEPAAPATVQMTSTKTALRLQIKGRRNLRQAMLAHIVFSPPQALDPSFDHGLSAD